MVCKLSMPCLLGFFLLCLSPLCGRAQENGLNGLVVTSLTGSRPAVVGHYATVQCVVQNKSAASLNLKALAVNLVGSDGSARPFGVWPFTNPKLPAALEPGQKYAFREFQRITVPGDFPVAVTAQNAEGTWTPLALVDGKAATILLHAVLPAEVPQVQYQVSDPNERHVYRAGDAIRIDVLPLVSGGPSLAAQVREVTVTTPTKPFAITDAAQAKSLLLGSDNSSGFTVDFWGVPDTQKELDIVVPFQHPVELSAWSLSGINLNGEYSVKGCAAEAVRPDGTTAALPSLVTTAGETWSALSASPQSLVASSLHLRLFTPYKIYLRSLTLSGSPRADRNAAAVARVTGRWQDASGKSLSPVLPLALFQKNALAAPSPLVPGYYGLVLTSKIAGMDDARHEYGFVVLPAPETSADMRQRDPRFDMVHGDANDPYLGIAWNKTLTTNFFDEKTRTLDAKAWKGAIAERKALGVQELPLISDSDWISDSARPVSPDQLDRLRAKMVQYFRATPDDVGYWELGIEENLGYRGNRDKWPYYWPNLEAKARAVRQAASDAHANVKFVYQIAENDLPDAEAFLKSDAARQFDILSLHPYWWPDFPTPESWMPDYIRQIRGFMARYHAAKPIWFTEIGAPVEANPGGFSGYPGDPGAFDKVLSREDHAAFTIKCLLVAWQQRIDKVFWYNYRDGGQNPEYAEDNFGMVDFWGFPKPTYAAYAAMANLLRDKPLRSTTIVGGNVHVSRFGGARQDVLAVWTYPASTKKVSLRALKVSSKSVAGARDLFGRPLALSGGTIAASAAPTYVLVNHPPSPERHVP